MGNTHRGKQSFSFDTPPVITHWASVVGKKEAQGPISNYFDVVKTDSYFGQKTWEQAEKRMQQIALQTLANKAGMQPKDFGLVFSGDLLNQCIGSSFTLRNTGIPHLGLYGACSTMAESLLIAAMTVGGGYFDNAVAITSSHFASSPKLPSSNSRSSLDIQSFKPYTRAIPSPTRTTVPFSLISIFELYSFICSLIILLISSLLGFIIQSPS